MKAVIRKFYKITAFILFIILPLIGKADHFIGSDLTWKCIGQDSFLVSLTIYRDCNGIPMHPIAIVAKCASTGATITTLNISKPQGVDITPTCGSSCTRCQTSGCSFPYGIERYVFTSLLVLSNAGSCCEIVMSFQSCCRNLTITTGIANQSFYCDGRLNRCINPCDNSPTFTNAPVAIICVGQDFIFNHGAIDIDISSTGGLIDSLSYEWTSPLGYGGAVLSYSSPYSYDKPIYFWGFPSTTLSFPRGFHLDKTTGDISFRPMKVEQTVMALKISEFRTINGVKVKIGEIRRDIQFIVISCPNNNAPILSGPFYKEVCATNTVSFSIATNDYDTKDTLLISWNGAIPGATWSSNNKQVKHPTGVMTWTPGEQHASPIPYVFTATVKDDACPVNGSSTRAYQILVKPLPKAKITEVDSGCGDYHLFAQPVLGNSPSFLWVGNFSGGFTIPGTYCHYKFKGPGKYPYSLKVDAQNCTRVYNDTIEVDTFLVLNLTKDHDICYGDTTELVAGYMYNQGKVDIKWSNGDTNQVIKYVGTKDTSFWVVIEDTMHCAAYDTVRIRVHQLPKVDLGPDSWLCSYGSMTAKASVLYDRSILDSILWIDGKDNSTLLQGDTVLGISDSGIYVCKVWDTLGCTQNDTLIVRKNDQIISFAQGKTICYGDTVTLWGTATGSKSAAVRYYWYNTSNGQMVGNKQGVVVSPPSTLDYKLVVKETQNGVECVDSSYVRVRVNDLPKATWGTIPERCVDGTILSLNNYVSTDPVTATKTWSSSSPGLLPTFPGDKFNPIVAGAGIHKVMLLLTNPLTGCKNLDSNYVTINPLPTPNAGPDKEICSGDGSVNLTGSPSAPAGEWRSLTGLGVIGMPGNYLFDPKQSGITDKSNHHLVYQYTDNKGCVNEDTMIMTVYITPVVNPGTYKDVCIDGGLVQLSGTPAGGTWSGTGVSGDKFNPSVAGVGTHKIKYKVTNVICTVENETSITVRPLPTIIVGTKSGQIKFCSNNGDIELNGLPSGGVWTGPGVNGNFFSTAINAGGTGEVSYDLEYRFVDQYGCVNKKTLTLTVRPAPEVTIDKTATGLCYPATYQGNSSFKSAGGVQWYKNNDSAGGNFIGNTTNNAIEYQPSPSDLGRLYFWLKIKTTHPDNVCLPAYDSIKVNMSALPVAGFIPDPKEACNPLTVQFTDTSKISAGHITKWEWSFGDGTTSTDQNPSHSYLTAGTYNVKLLVKSNANCSGDFNDNVISHVVPDAGFVPEPELVLISSPNIKFKNVTKQETPGIKWLWNFGDLKEPGGGTSKVRDPEWSYRDTGKFEINLWVENEFGCKDSSKRQVIVMPDVLAFVPSAFSPNDEGPEGNDTFRVVVEGITEFELKIYSRWGELLYESNDYNTHGWPGTYLNSNVQCPVGVYVYVMKLKGLDGADYKYSGSITLLK